MEAPDLINNRYSMSRGPVKQQQQFGSEIQSNNSNNTNNINVKHFGAGGHSHAMPRPAYSPSPISGHKRDSSGFDVGRGSSPASVDGGNFVKLFVGHVPRTVTEDDIRQLFAEHGHVLEVNMVREKRIGQQHGCYFIKYATIEEAERAIKALHNKHTLPGGISPLQVRFADGEREQLVEHKLFVGCLNKQASEDEIEEIFARFGHVDDIYIMRDEQKQSRGCAFVKYPSRDMAEAAISGLNGTYVMRGCSQPLAVRFAEPKRAKSGDMRNVPAFGGPGYGTELQRPFGSRPSFGGGGHMGGRGMASNWRPAGVASVRNPSPQVGSHPYVAPSTPSGRSGSVGGHSPMVGPTNVSQMSMNGPIQGSVHTSSTIGGPARMTAPPQLQGFNSPPAQRQSQPQGWIPPVQQPRQMQQQMQTTFQHQHSQPQQSHSQLQPAQQSLQYGQQMQASQPLAQQPQFGQLPVSQQSLSQYGQLPVSQSQVQQHAAPTLQQVVPLSMPAQSMQPHHQQQAQPQQQQPALQLVHQQQPTMQPNFQSQQHPSFAQQLQLPAAQAATQSQQQAVAIQPQQQAVPMQSQPQQAYYQVAPAQQTAQQQPWTFAAQPQTVAVASTSSMGPASTATEPVTAPTVASVSVQTPAPATCVWTEHTSPEGYKYYYNSVTGESKWEKPDELTVFEQQQKQLQQPRLQPQPQPQLQPQPQQQTQLQHPQLHHQQQPHLNQQQQPQAQHHQLHQQQHPQLQQQQQPQLQQQPQPQLQQQQPQIAQSTLPTQSLPTTQDWMWKARPAGA